MLTELPTLMSIVLGHFQSAQRAGSGRVVANERSEFSKNGRWYQVLARNSVVTVPLRLRLNSPDRPRHLKT